MAVVVVVVVDLDLLVSEAIIATVAVVEFGAACYVVVVDLLVLESFWAQREAMCQRFVRLAP